jgi:hypothetical protein
VTWEADFYLEFSSGLPRRFVLFDTYSGGAVYDLREGLRCNLNGPSGGDKGDFGRWPTFTESGRSLVLLHKEVLWRIDLESCAWTEIGKLPYPPKRDLVDAILVRALASPTGATFHAMFGETSRGPTSPHGIRPAQARFVLLGNENGQLVERRRVFGRLYNAMNGLEGAASDATRTPFLLITQFRSLSPAANSVALERSAFTADICFLLIETAQGHFFALRTPEQTGVGLRLDRNRGLVWYDGSWWDLHALAAWSGDDLA